MSDDEWKDYKPFWGLRSLLPALLSYLARELGRCAVFLFFVWLVFSQLFGLVRMLDRILP